MIGSSDDIIGIPYLSIGIPDLIIGNPIITVDPEYRVVLVEEWARAQHKILPIASISL